MTAKKIMLLLISIIIIFSTFGCGDKSSQKVSENTIFSFESMAEIENSINTFGTFGKVGFNDNAKYVSQGKGSLYLEFHNDGGVPMPNAGENELLFYVKTSDYVARTNSDYSNTQSIAFDAYNISDRDSRIFMCIYPEIGEAINLGSQVMLKNQKTICVFNIDLFIAAQNGFNNISMIVISFEQLDAGETPIKFYIDNLRSRDYIQKQPIEEKMPALTADNEVMFFESEYEVKTILKSALNRDNIIPFIRQPKLELNTDKRYVSQGDSSLKITRYPAKSQATEFRKEIHLLLDKDSIKRVNFTKYTGDLSSYNFYMDVYNEYDYEIGLVIKIYSSTGFIQNIFSLKPNQWNLIKINMATKTANDIIIDWVNLTDIAFMIQEHYGATNAYNYVDNIRIERV